MTMPRYAVMTGEMKDWTSLDGGQINPYASRLSVTAGGITAVISSYTLRDRGKEYLSDNKTESVMAACEMVLSSVGRDGKISEAR